MTEFPIMPGMGMDRDYQDRPEKPVGIPDKPGIQIGQDTGFVEVGRMPSHGRIDFEPRDILSERK